VFLGWPQKMLLQLDDTSVWTYRNNWEGIMDQIVNQIAEQTGISKDQARQAVQMVMGVLQDRLPAPIAAQIQGVLGGDTDGASQQIMGSIGGMFGKK
jgi:hypothetical protein